MTRGLINLSKVFLALFVLIGCGNKTRLKQDPGATQLEVIPGVSFQTVFDEVIKNNCLECHATYSNYQIVASQGDRFLDAVLSGRMPKGRPPLSVEEKSILQTWVDNGAPEFADKVSAPTPLEPTFTSLFTNVIGPKCIACHTGLANSPAPPDVNFSSYEDIIISNDKYAAIFGDGFLSQELGAESEIIFLVTDTSSPMPPLTLPGNTAYNENPIPKLTDAEVAALTAWILKGFPND